MRLVFLPMGVLVFAVFGFVLHRSADEALRRAALPWLSIGAYIVLFAEAVSIGRFSLPGSGFIIDGYLSMYSTGASLFTVATFQLGVLTLATSSRAWRRRGFGAAVAVALLCVGLNYVFLMPRLLAAREMISGKRYCVELVHYLEARNV